jgi:hypothetical protein
MLQLPLQYVPVDLEFALNSEIFLGCFSDERLNMRANLTSRNVITLPGFIFVQ